MKALLTAQLEIAGSILGRGFRLDTFGCVRFERPAAPPPQDSKTWDSPSPVLINKTGEAVPPHLRGASNVVGEVDD